MIERSSESPGRLELEDRRALVMVNDSVEPPTTGADAQRVGVVPALFAQHRTHLFGAGRIQGSESGRPRTSSTRNERGR